ncbi:hypothetical protein NXS98_12170 [Fontisphaera persica]|uniref:hypothetical protein n=1 Tax=Fontisphaera persica TaxID=2974023 RepID=UPI0024BFE635|nr:hypothetical protein [Fontisphaera persica]WCJ58476.1 hypothetical protein NXS98_12170 [Fontisphaera persica]
MRQDPNQWLADYVNHQINMGATTVHIPASLLAKASDEAIEAVRQLCQLCGVKVIIRGDE